MRSVARFFGLGVGAFAIVSFGQAQIPNVRFRLDLTMAYVTENGGPTSLRLYDPLGDTSTASLTFFLEPGLKGFVSERLQRIPGDPDRELLEEYYVEDTGIWRLGKQFLPFGSGHILRENVLAARADTNLVLEHVPLAAAICDGPPGLQQGVIGRIGDKIGISAAYGSHFGISPTSLDYIRRTEDSPGPYRGWHQAWGIDGSHKSGMFTSKLEFVWLTDGQTFRDKNLSVFDANETIQPIKNTSFTVGWTRQEPNQEDYYRLLASIGFMRNGFFEPMIRYRDGRLYDVSIGVRIRL